jgi:ketosteroid isomerase-like protein
LLLSREQALRVMSTEEEVRRIESDWGEAFERDMAALDRLMADDYVLTDPLGNVRTKAESLAAIEANELRFEKYRERRC